MTSKNEIPVKIHVETVHRQDGQKEEYAEDFDGRLIEIGETVYLRYEEELPLSKLLNSIISSNHSLYHRLI